MKNNLNYILGIYAYSAFFLLLLSFSLNADEISFKFKSPSFSGLNTSSHYLTIENQEASKKQTKIDEATSRQEKIERDQANSTISRFLRNFESRVYAQLSRQMVEQLFGESPQKSGKLELEGNTIEYAIEEDEFITLIITESDGSQTSITIPVDQFSF